MTTATSVIRELANSLTEIVGSSYVTNDPESLAGLGFGSDSLPEVAAWPGTAGEVREILRLAGRAQISVMPVGGGTRIGQVAMPGFGGLAICLSRMAGIVEFEPDNLSVTVEAGCTNEALQQALQLNRLFLPVPADLHQSTLGGEVARNHSSWRRYRYGNIGDYLLGAEFVTADGRRVKTGGKTVKNASGYDFTRLLAGSWGTIGILTSLILRLSPQPERRVVLTGRYAAPAEALKAALAAMVATRGLSSLNVYGDNGGSVILAAVLEGSAEAVDAQLTCLSAHLPDFSAREYDEGQADDETRRRVRTDLHGGHIHTVIFDKRLSCNMTGLIDFLLEQEAVYDLDLTSGVLEFCLPGLRAPLLEGFLRQWRQLARRLKPSPWADFEQIDAPPLLTRLRTQIDPDGVLFPGNSFLSEVCRDNGR